MENVRRIAKFLLKYSKYSIQNTEKIHLNLAFGRSDLAAVWFDLIDSIIKEPGSFIHDSFLFS